MDSTGIIKWVKLFYELTGLHCPGCGITRAVLALLQGNIYQSFRYNPLLYIVVPLIIVTSIINFLNKDNKIIKIIVNVMYVILIIITLAYGIMRNIPYFSFLAPTII